MKSTPDKDEVLALIAAWLIWPSFHFAGMVVRPILAQLSVALPMPTRLAFSVMHTNRFFIPSLVATGAVVLVTRCASSPEAKRFLCHGLTLLSFFFTIAIILTFLTVVRAVK